jgi:hypothetical protein
VWSSGSRYHVILDMDNIILDDDDDHCICRVQVTSTLKTESSETYLFISFWLI